MKKILTLISALTLFCSCVIERGGKTSVTPYDLSRYADVALLLKVAAPAAELGHYLFIDEYRTADADARAALEESYGLKGAVHMIDEQTFHIDGDGDFHTEGKPFRDGGWGSAWTVDDEGVWSDGGGVSVEPVSKDGVVSGFKVGYDGAVVLEKYSWYESSVSLTDGPVTVSNIEKLRLDRIRPFIDGQRVFDAVNLSYYTWECDLEYSGVLRVDIRRLDKSVDYVVFSGTSGGDASYSTSRD